MEVNHHYSSPLFSPAPQTRDVSCLALRVQNFFHERAGSEMEVYHALSEEKATLANIKAGWNDNTHDEIARLVGKGILTSQIMSSLSAPFGDWTKVILGRSLEIMENYKESHFVFTHGKNYYGSLIDDFIKDIFRAYQPGACRSLYKHTRLPNVSSQIKNCKDFFNLFKPYEKNFSDNVHTNHLISGDWNLFSGESCESALDCFTLNTSIMMRWGESSIKRKLKKGLKPLIRNKVVRNGLMRKVSSLINNEIEERDGRYSGGAFYIFCIPKDVIRNEQTNFVYLSHEYGKPCSHYEGSPADIIEGLQNKTIEQRCRSQVCIRDEMYEKKCISQVRILTGPLAKCQGARIFRLAAEPKHKRKEIKMKFRHYIVEAQKEDQALLTQDGQNVLEMLQRNVESGQDMNEDKINKAIKEHYSELVKTRWETYKDQKKKKKAVNLIKRAWKIYSEQKKV